MTLCIVLTMVSCSSETELNGKKNSIDKQDDISDNFKNGAQDNDTSSRKLEGYIVFTDSVLLIEDPNFNQEDIHLTVKELRKKYRRISFLHDISDSQKKHIKSGQKVRITARMILESYPAKVYVSKIEIIEN